MNTYARVMPEMLRDAAAMNTVTEPTAASSSALLSALPSNSQKRIRRSSNVGKSLGNGGAKGDRTPDLMTASSNGAIFLNQNN
jgi:hypothetical protein